MPPDLSICTFVLEQSLSVRALQEMLANTEEKAEGVSLKATHTCILTYMHREGRLMVWCGQVRTHRRRWWTHVDAQFNRAGRGAEELIIAESCSDPFSAAAERNPSSLPAARHHTPLYIFDASHSIWP